MAPTFVELDSFQVDLSEEVRQYLASFYGNLDEILDSLKRSPAVTTVRANLIHTTPAELRGRLETVYEDWAYHHVQDDLQVQVTHHDVLDDVLEISVARSNNNVSFFEPSSEIQRVLVDRLCGEAVLRGANVFAPGILAAAKNLASTTVAIYAHVDGKVPNRGSTVLETDEYTCVRVGTGTAMGPRLFTLKTGVGIRVHPGVPPLPPLDGVFNGSENDVCYFMAQNLPSMVVAHVLDLTTSDGSLTVLDMCSAPGGKSLHIASRLRNHGTLVSCDKSRKKILKAKEVFAAAGATCITPLVLNSAKCVVEDYRAVSQILSLSSLDDDGLREVKGFPSNSFDRIALDPPCSALGLRPKLKITQTTVKSLLSFADYQRRLFGEAVTLLKPGGILCYSTCTIHPAENEGMVKHVLEEYSNMELLPIELNIGLPGLGNYGLNSRYCTYVRRFDPASDTIGFFVAKFRKKQPQL